MFFIGFDDAFRAIERLSMYVFDLPIDTAVKQFKDMNEAFWKKEGHNEIAKFYNSSMIGKYIESPICTFYNPNLSGKNVMWYTTFDQNHYY